MFGIKVVLLGSSKNHVHGRLMQERHFRFRVIHPAQGLVEKLILQVIDLTFLFSWQLTLLIITFLLKYGDKAFNNFWFFLFLFLVKLARPPFLTEFPDQFIRVLVLLLDVDWANFSDKGGKTFLRFLVRIDSEIYIGVIAEQGVSVVEHHFEIVLEGSEMLAFVMPALH